jgi:hypothetical protein
MPCTGMTFKLGACLSERGAAGTNAQQVEENAIGAGIVIGTALAGPVADVIGGLFASSAPEDTAVAGARGAA